MKNLRGSLIAPAKLPELDITGDLNTRYVDVTFAEGYTEKNVKEIKTSNTCCICEQNMWIRDYPEHSILIEGFKIVDARAYINGTPDYIKIPNCLLECHYGECQEKLVKTINEGTFVKR